MDKFKHTPGPWTTSEVSNTIAGVDIDSGRKTVASLAAYEFRGCSIEETNANARLIASAPELLEALQNLVEAVEEMESTDQYLSVAKSAIAKALGKETAHV